jgi:hypothetical protein
LNNPRGVALSSTGSTIIADYYTVRKVEDDGTLTTLAGSSYPYVYPNQLAADGAGNLYFTDSNYSVVRKLSPVPAFCSYSVAGPGTASGSAGAATIGVTTSPGCQWSATSDSSWATVASASSSGTNTLTVNLAKNMTNSQRTAIVTVAGQNLAVVQAAYVCPFSLSLLSASVPSEGGTVSVNVGTDATCSYGIATNFPWITFTAPGNGTGPDQVRVSIARNTGIARTGTVFIAGTFVRFSQAGAPGAGPQLILQNALNNGVSGWFLGGTDGRTLLNAPWFATSAPNWAVRAAADMNSDGVLDYVLQNATTGAVSIWFMGGSSGLSWVSTPIVGTAAPNSWVIAAADMNGDGTPDILTQNSSTNQIVVSYMAAGGRSVGSTGVVGNPAPGWSLVATGDINQDGVPDLLLQNTNSNALSVWFMKPGGTSGFYSAPIVATPVPGWAVVGTSDLNNDGVPDYLLQHRYTGAVSAWYMTGTAGSTYSSAPMIYQAAPNWWIRGTH